MSPAPLARLALLLGSLAATACAYGRLDEAHDGGTAALRDASMLPPAVRRDAGYDAGAGDAGGDVRDASVADGATPSADGGDTHEPPPPFNDTEVQLETFWTTYGGKESAPSSYVTAIEAFLRAEDEVERGDFAAARARIDRVFTDYPLSTPAWWAGAGREGANVGSPVAYYGLRMLDEIVRRAELASAREARAIRMTVVMARCARGMRPTSADLSSGEPVSLALDASLEADDHRVIRQSLRVFQQYVWAITSGALRVELDFAPVDECVSVVYRDNPTYSGIEDAQAAINQVPQSVQASTDMWWVLYPSNVPEGAQFDAMSFITGGMGGRGRAPVFIIDDLWLVRKPAHLGRGPYTEAERRLYLPQWLQHEFFHHLFRTWPELGLEATGHQWFDRTTWPSDFVGEWEPDYYAEALQKRLDAAEPSLASALQVAAPTSLIRSLRQQDFVGSYERRPVENGWHRVTLSVVDGQLVWRNEAGVQWGLTWSDGTLRSGSDSPYGQQPLSIELQRNASGDPIAQVRALGFSGEAYLRL